MNEFLTALELSLSGMDAEEKREIRSDYEEHFSLGLAAGKTEEQIAASLGDPDQLAKMYIALKAAKKAHHGGFADAMRMIGAALRFRVGGGLTMGALYFVCFGAIATLYITATALIVTSLGCIVLTGMEIARGYVAYAALAIFTALIFGSGGLLWLLGNTKLWKACATRLPLLTRRMMKPRSTKELL